MPYLDYRLGRGSRKMPDYASISGHFARCFAYFARVSGIMVMCSEMTECGKSEQNPASCYYLLVVKLVVKGKWLLLKVLSFLLHLLKYFLIFRGNLGFALKLQIAADQSRIEQVFTTC